jgi:hypothetical protein
MTDSIRNKGNKAPLPNLTVQSSSFSTSPHLSSSPADPRQRLYSSDLSAPVILPILMASMVKQAILQQINTDKFASFAAEYYEQMIKEREKEEKQLDLPNFINIYNKQLESQYLKQRSSNNANSTADPSNPAVPTPSQSLPLQFSEPSGLRVLLLPFSREFIRYSPPQDQCLQFSWEYFKCLAESPEQLQEWLLQQARLNENKWKDYQEKSGNIAHLLSASVSKINSSNNSQLNSPRSHNDISFQQQQQQALTSSRRNKASKAPTMNGHHTIDINANNNSKNSNSNISSDSNSAVNSAKSRKHKSKPNLNAQELNFNELTPDTNNNTAATT